MSSGRSCKMYVHRTVRWVKWLAARSWAAAGRNYFQRFSKSSGGSWKVQIRCFCFSFFSCCALCCLLVGWALLYRLAACVCVSVFYTVTLLLLQSYGMISSPRQKIIQYSLSQFRLDLGNLLTFKLKLVFI